MKKKKIDKYKINRNMTVDLLEKQSNDPDLAQAAYDRNKEAVETYKTWIRGDILEIGCRHGVLFDILNETPRFGPVNKIGGDLYGIDISPEAIKLLRERGFTGDVMSAEEIIDTPDLHNRFDTVFCLHTLEHCVNLPAVIHGIYESLKPGGHALMEIPIQPKEIVPTIWGHYHCFGWTGELIEMMCPPFKHIQTFQQNNHNWRRYIFGKI